VKHVQQSLKTTQDKWTSNVNKKRSKQSFKVREKVFLRVKLKRISIPRNMEEIDTKILWTFEILAQIGVIAYKLASQLLLTIHDVLYVSLFKKYVYNPNHILNL
jgi:hypothetical protein